MASLQFQSLSHSVGWHQKGDIIKYFRNNISYKIPQPGSFKVTFNKDLAVATDINNKNKSYYLLNTHVQILKSGTFVFYITQFPLSVLLVYRPIKKIRPIKK